VDVLRQIVLENLPQDTVERFAWNVPCYYGKRQICIIWPASVPRGGIKTGVLFGFSKGFMLKDRAEYLTRGTNKVIYYKIYRSVDEIDEQAITSLLNEAVKLDRSF
jgi:hypothetical protein